MSNRRNSRGETFKGEGPHYEFSKCVRTHKKGQKESCYAVKKVKRCRSFVTYGDACIKGSDNTHGFTIETITFTFTFSH